MVPAGAAKRSARRGASSAPAHPATISSRLKDRFVDQGDAIEREVSAFLAELRQRGLIEG